MAKSLTDRQSPTRVRIVVATSVMLSFISFWRAAAIVLNDMGSSAFYVPSIAEQAYGKAAPWFILAVMLFAYAVRAVYIESCAMFTRGGVYRVVKEAMGGTMGKLAVSALLFDYVLTGPISGVSAGQYIVGLINDSGHYLGIRHEVPRDLGAMTFAIAATLYFWRKNVIGLHESSEKALRIMYLVTALVVLAWSWSAVTLLLRGGQWPPLPSLDNLHFQKHALGWLNGSLLPQITVFAFLIAFGHSVLAMSGEETMAQVNREIEHPKLTNLKRAGFIIFIFSLVFTAGTAFLGVALVPDAERTTRYSDNLLSGIAMYLVGPHVLRLLFQVFVVLVGTLMLAGAVNTAIIGSNGVLNRVAEDGVLTDWFRRPHRRYGTSYRMLNLIVGLQLFTILASRGNVYMLGEAYAFGVIWSFTMMTTSILVLRFKNPSPREWRVPGNFKIGRYEIPAGVSLIVLVLFAAAVMNLFTKKTATISGMVFTGVLFAVFTVSERVTARRRKTQVGIEHFNLTAAEQVSCDVVGCRAGNVLVAVRDHNHLQHLATVLQRTDTDTRDVVVMTTRLMQGADFSEQRFIGEEAFGEYEQKLFSGVVTLTEKLGKPVSLAIVPGTNPEDALMLTAQRLGSGTIVVGHSENYSAEEKARLIGLSWERLPHPRPRITLQVVAPSGEARSFLLGPHAPALRPEDVELLHRMWLEMTAEPAYRNVHHHQLISLALRRFAAALRGPDRDVIRAEIRHIANSESHDHR